MVIVQPERLGQWKIPMAQSRIEPATFWLVVQCFNPAQSGLRHCATSRKVAGSIPCGVIGIFHWHIPSGRTLALGLTQPLTEMSTGNISWGGKGGRCVGFTTLSPSRVDCLEISEPQPPGILRACPGIFYLSDIVPFMETAGMRINYNKT
jgi:hypothetical protein